MTNRYFHLRLSSTYKDPENNIDELNVEVLHDNEWETINLDTKSPGFLLFITGLFSCQHLYMRTNCAECNLAIKSTAGDLQVVTSENWEIKDATVSFNINLKSGSPTEANINYITDRMKHCPVTTNLPDSIHLKNTIHFDKFDDD